MPRLAISSLNKNLLMKHHLNTEQTVSILVDPMQALYEYFESLRYLQFDQVLISLDHQNPGKRRKTKTTTQATQEVRTIIFVR
jgi:hypothetical protein